MNSEVNITSDFFEYVNELNTFNKESLKVKKWLNKDNLRGMYLFEDSKAIYYEADNIPKYVLKFIKNFADVNLYKFLYK